MSSFFERLWALPRGLARERRLPLRDRVQCGLLVLLILSPVDFIPDWLVPWGQLDDALMLALLLDYLFRVIKPEILHEHYAFAPASYDFWRAAARLLSFWIPEGIKNRLWAYRRP